MSKPSIEYLNARRDLKHARAGGSFQDWSARPAPIDEIDPVERTELECDSRCNMLQIQCDAMWQQIFERFGIVRAEHIDEIPF